MLSGPASHTFQHLLTLRSDLVSRRMSIVMDGKTANGFASLAKLTNITSADLLSAQIGALAEGTLAVPKY